MKSITTIIFGLLLLVSAAAAEGNNNIVNVDVADNMAGQVMTNADFAQVSNIDANLIGNSIHADQISSIDAIDNILTGSKPDGETFFYQSVDQSISDTGNNNFDRQIAGSGKTYYPSKGLLAAENTLTDSVVNQELYQSETIGGNNNAASQIAGSNDATDYVDMYQSATVIIGDYSIHLGRFNADYSSANGINATDNTLTNSVINQELRQSEMIDGNDNAASQIAGDNDATTNTFTAQDATASGDSSSIVLSWCNAVYSFANGINAADNTLTNSVINQELCQSESIDGNDNEASQVAGDNDAATDVSTEQDATASGFINFIDQDTWIDVYSSANGINAADNTLTSSAINQELRQSETIAGNDNAASQIAGSNDTIIDVSAAQDATASGFINSIDQNIWIDVYSSANGINAADNTLTNSVINQELRQSESIDGNNNAASQIAGGNDALFDTFAAPDATASRDSTSIDLNTWMDVYSSANGINAANNILTNSAANQMISQSEKIDGNSNEATQIANSIMTADILTGSNALQIIDEDAISVGDFNTIFHDGKLTSTENTVTGGSILQHTDIFTSS